MIQLPNSLNTILHIGAGHGDELSAYLESDAQHILLVEPNPNLAARLRARTQNDARVTVVETAITDDLAQNQLTEYNLPEAASLHQPTGLRQSFPGLRITAQHPVATSTLQQLLEKHPPGKGNNLLVLQVPGTELEIIKALATADTTEPFSHLWLTCPHEAFYNTASRASDALAELQRQGYDVQNEGAKHDDWPQWQLACNPLARKVQALDTEKQALTEALKQAQSELDDANATLASSKNELTEARKNFDHQQSAWQTEKQKLEDKANELQSLKSELDKRKKRVGQLKEQLESSQQSQNKIQTELEQQTKRLKAMEQENGQLKQSLQQLQAQLESDTSSQSEMADLKKRMEYLFEQNSLQLEQAANALGRHVSTTAQTTAKELEAGIALQQQYGGDLPSFEQGNTRLPSTVALALSRQLKTQPYDLIIELGSGVTTTFMAHTLRNHNGQRSNGEKSTDTQVSRYIDASEDDLPKRIVCFEHNRAAYNQRLESLKASGLSPLIGLQFAPLVPYSYQGQEYLFYDCANRLQQIARLFEERQAHIFVLVNQPGGESQPEPLVALPQVLQYLSAHTLDVVVNTQGRTEITDQWQALLTQRGLEAQIAEFGAKHVQRVTVNP